ncbi:MAG: hypothetical protein O2983_11995, partial [Planctomycetota bacterium]|nr:hypothetical protein [Planctomycetota bacterium]
GLDVPISRVVSVNSAQSYVGELVAADIGSGATELGTVRGVVNRDGIDFLIFETVDNSGDVQSSEIDPGKVKNVLRLQDVEDKNVQAVTKDGQVLSGRAIVATDGTQDRLFVQGVSIGLDRIVSVGLN